MKASLEKLKALVAIFMPTNQSEISSAVCQLCETECVPEPSVVCKGLDRWVLVAQGEKSFQTWKVSRSDIAAYHAGAACFGCSAFGAHGMCPHIYSSFILTGILDFGRSGPSSSLSTSFTPCFSISF